MNKLIKSMAAILFASIAFLGCDDETDVIGLNDLTKNGFIKVTIKGARPDGEEFEVTKNFKFSPSTGPAYSSEVDSYLNENTQYRDFYITRYLGAINESGDGEENRAQLQLYVNEGDSEDDTPSFVESGFYLETSVMTSDKEYFYINENIGIDADDVTSYQFNPETGKLSFKYQTVLEQSNSTGYPMQITIQANVTVFERLYNDQI